MGRWLGITFILGLACTAGNIDSLIPSTPASVVTTKMMSENTLAHMDADTREAARSATPDVEIHANPLVASMARIGKNRKAEQRPPISERFVSWLDASKEKLAAAAMQTPIGLLLMAFVAFALGFKAISRACVMICFSVARKWLFLLSIAAVFVFYSRHINLFHTLPPAMWGAPAAAVIACLVFLRQLDLNYPLWNSAVLSFFPPLAAKLSLAAVIFLD